MTTGMPASHRLIHTRMGTQTLRASASTQATQAARNTQHTLAQMTISKSRLPKVVAFDLDGTLWYPEMDMLWGGPPFKPMGPGRVKDSQGKPITLIGDSLTILQELASSPQWQDTRVAYVSRTDCIENAEECLKAMEVAPGRSMDDLADHKEIFPGRKTEHFTNILNQSGVAFEDMLFFDNERRNITDCQALGITCIYTPQGMTKELWLRGLQKHAARSQP